MAGLEGRVLSDRYRVDEYVGGGGMADVYKVWDQTRSCHLAIKLLRQSLSEFEEFGERFQREADVLARLQHPNIVRLYGFEQDADEGFAFIVMDYVDGPTLANKLKIARGPLPLSEVVSITDDVASALSYAHNQGVYHRDIKPSNIIIARDGRAVLSDFGIARLSDALTLTYQGIGTPAYMSPEQCAGEEPGALSDIYSLGVVVYECLTGRRPFIGDMGRGDPPTTANVLKEHLEFPPPMPSDVNPSLSAAVEAVILRALAKDPRYRCQSARDLARDLRAASGVPALPSLRVITSPGAAKVYVDDELRGASPLEIPHLAPGSHEVRVELTGYRTHIETVDPSQPMTLEIGLEREAAATAATLPDEPEEATQEARPQDEDSTIGGPPQPPTAARGGRFRRWKRPLLIVGGVLAVAAIAALLAFLRLGGDGEDAAVSGLTPTPDTTVAPTSSPSPATPTSTPTGGASLTFEGSFSRDGEQQRHRFEGRQGQFVMVRMKRDPAGNVTPHFTLEDPLGDEAATADAGYDGDYAVLEHTLARSGDYVIVAESRGGLGPYVIGVDIDPFTTLTGDSEITAEIGEPGERDWYAFDGLPDQLVVARVDRDPTGNVSPRLTVIDPFGEEVKSEQAGYSEGYVILKYRLVDEGRFKLVAEARDNATGPYVLRFALDQFVPLTPGIPVEGSFDLPDQEVMYQFDGAAGQELSAQVVADSSGSVSPSLRLVDPFGQEVASALAGYREGTVSLDKALGDTGTFTLIVSSRESGDRGQYTLTSELRQ